MERIDSIEDRMRRVERYRLPDGRMVCFDSDYIAEVGLGKALRGEGIEPPTERVPVYRCDEMIGTVPALFDPDRIQSTSFLYYPRPGDFIRDGNKWIADPILGSSDLDHVPGFVWSRQTQKEDK